MLVTWFIAGLLACVPAEADRLPVLSALDSLGGAYHLELSPEPDPPTAGDTALTIALTAGGEPSPGAALTLLPWMPDHGHGVSSEPEVSEQEGAVYQATWLYPMPGYWEITVTIDGDAGLDEVVVAYEVQ
jgi:hypothetical protein